MVTSICNRLESGPLSLITQPLAKFAITTVMDGKGFQMLFLFDIIHTTHIYILYLGDIDIVLEYIKKNSFSCNGTFSSSQQSILSSTLLHHKFSKSCIHWAPAWQCCWCSASHQTSSITEKPLQTLKMQYKYVMSFPLRDNCSMNLAIRNSIVSWSTNEFTNYWVYNV